MQGPPGGGGWNPGGGPPPGGWGPPQPQGSAPGQTQSSPGGPAKTVALSQAELASVHGATQPPGAPAPVGAPGMPPQAAPAYAPAMAQPVEAKPVPTNVGLFLGVAWLLVGLLACLATAAAAALMGEGDAVVVSYLCVPVAVAGLVAPIVGGLTRTQSPAVAIGSPLGCGCATMMVTLVAVIVFYQAIWPSL